MVKAYIPVSVTGSTDLYCSGFSNYVEASQDTGLGTPQLTVTPGVDRTGKLTFTWGGVSNATGYILKQSTSLNGTYTTVSGVVNSGDSKQYTSRDKLYFRLIAVNNTLFASEVYSHYYQSAEIVAP